MLSKRLFTFVAGSQDTKDASKSKSPTKAQVDAYIPAVYKEEENAYFGQWLATSVSSDERPLSQQVVFGDRPFQIMSPKMHGCTALILVSKRAVWMTHLWESYSNGKEDYLDKKTGKWGKRNPTGPGDPAFNQRVLMFLRGQTVTNPLPNGYKDYQKPKGPGIDASLFNDGRSDSTTLYIYTPLWDPYHLKYEERYGSTCEVVQTITDILGGERPHVVVTPYMPLDTDDPVQEAQLGENGRGAALFQYDPSSDGKGRKQWRIFMETRGFITGNVRVR
ncbi:hypothetical protein ACEPPN_018885 [Leptodophora sp. 'Broadleaf-Isolate-01']